MAGTAVVGRAGQQPARFVPVQRSIHELDENKPDSVICSGGSCLNSQLLAAQWPYNRPENGIGVSTSLA